jgi:hypothetical protein
MKVLSIEDRPDGSAIVEIEITNEEKDMFIEIGILTALQKGLERHKEIMIDDYINSERE